MTELQDKYAIVKMHDLALHFWDSFIDQNRKKVRLLNREELKEAWNDESFDHLYPLYHDSPSYRKLWDKMNAPRKRCKGLKVELKDY